MFLLEGLREKNGRASGVQKRPIVAGGVLGRNPASDKKRNVPRDETKRLSSVKRTNVSQSRSTRGGEISAKNRQQLPQKNGEKGKRVELLTGVTGCEQRKGGANMYQDKVDFGVTKNSGRP